MDILEIQRMHAEIILGMKTHGKNQPEDKVEAGEKVLGVIADPVTRSLWSLCQQLESYLDDYITVLEPKNLDAMKKLEAEFSKHSQHILSVLHATQAVASDMWARVEKEFPESADVRVENAIREGFTVVIWKKEKPEKKPALVALVEIVSKASKKEAEGEKKGQPAAAPAGTPA